MIRRVEIDLPLAGLGGALTFDFISDIHLRNQRQLDAFVAATAAPVSDTVLLGGDYCEERRFLRPLFRHLAEVYPERIAVYGNNDHVVRPILTEFAAEGLARFLEDEVIEWNGVHLLGTRDPAKDKVVLPPLPPSPLLVLSHSPDVLLSLPSDRSLTLLTGHVHGGQFRIPFWPWWWTHTRIGRSHGEGHSRRGQNEIFTGRGIGCSLMELRNVPREIYTVRCTPA